MENSFPPLSQFDDVLSAAIKKYQVAADNLTEQQVMEALKQAIACGDFTRVVRDDGSGQTVVYLPFHREQELEFRINELERELEAWKTGKVMARERWIAVMENDAPLTEKEISDGWHFCGDWDGLLVGPGMGELDCCNCKKG